MSYMKSHVAVAFLVLALVGCVSTKENVDTGFYPATSSEVATVVVQNNNWSEMTIFAIVGGSRWRLGSVSTGRAARFVIPAALVAAPELSIQADPIGPDHSLTLRRISLMPGSTIELTLANNLALSNYSIR